MRWTVPSFLRQASDESENQAPLRLVRDEPPVGQPAVLRRIPGRAKGHVVMDLGRAAQADRLADDRPVDVAGAAAADGDVGAWRIQSEVRLTAGVATGGEHHARAGAAGA